MRPFHDSTGDLGDRATLAARMRADGYLFVRGLLPPPAVANVQRQVAAIAQAAGWLRQDSDPAAALAEPAGFCVDPEPRYLAPLRRINHLEDYHALKHHPALIGFMQALLDGPILPHPRVLMRNIFPARDEFTTKAHQDFPNVQGTTEVYTAWIPLIDCPMTVGPLQVAVGTHGGEIYDFQVAAGAGGIEIAEPFAGRWVCSPFAQGDVLFFHSMTVHKGVANRSDRLRMSMDVRYQRADAPFNPDNANPDAQPLDWEAIYAGWRSDALKYYWRDMDLSLRAFDRSWFDARDRMGFAPGEAGDRRAVSVLQRIAARDPDPAKRARAEALLAALG